MGLFVLTWASLVSFIVYKTIVDDLDWVGAILSSLLAGVVCSLAIGLPIAILSDIHVERDYKTREIQILEIDHRDLFGEEFNYRYKTNQGAIKAGKIPTDQTDLFFEDRDDALLVVHEPQAELGFFKLFFADPLHTEYDLYVPDPELDNTAAR